MGCSWGFHCWFIAGSWLVSVLLLLCFLLLFFVFCLFFLLLLFFVVLCCSCVVLHCCCLGVVLVFCRCFDVLFLCVWCGGGSGGGGIEVRGGQGQLSNWEGWWWGCGVVWCGGAWRGVAWCGAARRVARGAWCVVGGVWCVACGVWRGVVWCGVVWCGVAVSYAHLRAHETKENLVRRLLLVKIRIHTHA